MNPVNSLVLSHKQANNSNHGGGSGISQQAAEQVKQRKTPKQQQFPHLIKPPQPPPAHQEILNTHLHNNPSSHFQPSLTPQPTNNLKQQYLNVHLRSASELQQSTQIHQQFKGSQISPQSMLSKQLNGSTPQILENPKTRSFMMTKPPSNQVSLKSNIGSKQNDNEGTTEAKHHQHKNSGGSYVNLNLIPPVHNIQLLEGSNTLSNFIKRTKKRRGDKKAKLSKLAIFGLGFNQGAALADDTDILENNIDKGMLLKPGEEFDSSAEEESEDENLGVMLKAKQHHSIHLLDEIQGVFIEQTKSTIHNDEPSIEDNNRRVSQANDKISTQSQKQLQMIEILEQENTEQLILLPDNDASSKDGGLKKISSQKSTDIFINQCIRSSSQEDLASTAIMSNPRISDFARSINRMSDITRQISSKVQQLRQSQIDDNKQIQELEGQSVREEDQYEVEEENPEEDHAWRYNNRAEEITQQRKRKQMAADGPQEEPGLKLKEGQIILPNIGANLPKEVFETQIVDQYTIYGQNVLRTVLRQMGPPKTKYGQLLLNQIVQSQKQQLGQAVAKKNDPNIMQILKQIKSGNSNAAQQAAQLIQQAQYVPYQQNLANFNTLQQPCTQSTNNQQNNGGGTQIQQQKQNDVQLQANRIFLSLADHQKKRYKTCVTMKTQDDKIMLAPLNYDIPNQLVDKKFMTTFVKRGPNGGITSSLAPLLINEDSYDKMTAHYIRLKDVKKLYVRDETAENFFFQGYYDFEDQYEVLEELDYYRRELRRQAAIEENRRKNVKMANVKAAAFKLQSQKQNSESPNLFRERYRYNYINWLKQQQRSDGKKLEGSDSLNNLESTNNKQINQIELMTVESFQDRMPTIQHLENQNHQSEKQPGLVVQFRKDKVVAGSNEVNRSKIGSFLQLINNAASGIGNNQNIQLSAIGSNIPLKSGQLQHQGSSTQVGSAVGQFRTPDKAMSLGTIGGSGSYKLQTMSHPFLVSQESQCQGRTLDPFLQTNYPQSELNSAQYAHSYTTLQSCKNAQIPQTSFQQQSVERTTLTSNFISSPQQAQINLTQNFQLRQNVENELKMQHLQRDAGKLISKFEELNKEHEELEKLKRYADNHFHHGVGNAGSTDSFVAQQNQSQSLKALHRPSQSGLTQQSPTQPKLETSDYFAMLNNAQFGDINNPSPLFGITPGQLTIGPSQSQQRLQMKTNSASTFGIKLQNNQTSQVHKVQQQSRFNIILANKKHNLQRKYMELIREKDQVLNEFYSYAKIASNVQKNLANNNAGVSSKNPLSSEISSPTKAQEIAHKANLNNFPLEDSQDTIGDLNPTFDLQSKKVFLEDESKKPYKTIQKDNTPIGILSQNVGRMGAYTLYKSSKTIKFQNNKNLPTQQNTRLLLPPAISQHNNSRMDARVQVFSRKGLTSSQDTTKPLKSLNSPNKNQVLIEQQLTLTQTETIKEGTLLESGYSIEKEDNQLNLKIPNLATVTSASGVFNLYSITRREEGGSTANVQNNGSNTSNFLSNSTSQAKNINELLKRRQSQNRIISNITSNREPQMYRGSYQKIGGDLEQILQMEDVQQATREVLLQQPSVISNIAPKGNKQKFSHGSTHIRPSGEGGNGIGQGTNTSKLHNNSPQKIIHKKPNTNA